MTFAQLHDGFYRNPKVRKAGHAAAWLWASSIGYASENLTDGFVPSHDLSLLVSDLEGKALAKAVARLVEVGLWEVAAGGWNVHDYLKWNLSKAAVLAKRETTLARVNKHRSGPRHGEGNARVMRFNASSNAGCNAVTPPVTDGVSNNTPTDPTPTDPPPVGESRAHEGAPPREEPAAPTTQVKPPLGDSAPTVGDIVHAFRDGAFGVASIGGDAPTLALLGRVLLDLDVTEDEARAMGAALGSPSAWWPPGSDAPRNVTLRALRGFYNREAKAHEWGPVQELTAHVRAEARRRERRAADERKVAEMRRPPPPEAPPGDAAVTAMDFAEVMKQVAREKAVSRG